MCRRELSSDRDSPMALSTIDLRVAPHDGCGAKIR